MIDLEIKAGEQGHEKNDVVEVLAWSDARFQAVTQTSRKSPPLLQVDFRTNEHFTTALACKGWRYRGATYEEIAVVDLLMVFLDAYIAKNPLAERASRHIARFLRSIGRDSDASQSAAAAWRVTSSDREALLRRDGKNHAEVLPILGLALEELTEAHALTVVLCDTRLHRFSLTQVAGHLQRARPTLTRNQVSYFLRSRVRIEQGLRQASQMPGSKWPREELGHLTMKTGTRLDLHDARFLAARLEHAKARPVERNNELRRIEKEYWRQRGVEFTALSEHELNKPASDGTAAGEQDHG